MEQEVGKAITTTPSSCCWVVGVAREQEVVADTETAGPSPAPFWADTFNEYSISGSRPPHS